MDKEEVERDLMSISEVLVYLAIGANNAAQIGTDSTTYGLHHILMGQVEKLYEVINKIA